MRIRKSYLPKLHELQSKWDVLLLMRLLSFRIKIDWNRLFKIIKIPLVKIMHLFTKKISKPFRMKYMHVYLIIEFDIF